MLKRIAAATGLALGAVAYVWYAAVRSLPEVRRRKAALRAGAVFRRKPH